MATTTPDPLDSVNLNALAIDSLEKHVGTENQKEQATSTKDAKTVSHNTSTDPNNVDPSKDASRPQGSVDSSGDKTAAYPPNIYAPQAFCYGGYENAGGEWEEYPPYLNNERIEFGSAGMYTENPSLMFHTGYGYSPQMPYGPYSPVTTPLPSVSGEGQLYSGQQFPFPGTYYQQPVSPSMPYLTSPVPVSQPDLSLIIEQPDWMKSMDSTGSWTPLSSPSPQPIGGLGSFGQAMNLSASGMSSQQQRWSYGFGSSVNSYDRLYSHVGIYQQGGNFGGYFPNQGTSRRSLLAFDKARRRGKGSVSLCSCNGALDFLNEQNRGPRATRPKNSTAEQNSFTDSQRASSALLTNSEQYNRPDFITEYKDARFFVIKSYSEDNVHKSIKYGVWASTANGNKKLNSAYRDAKAKEEPCPVFLFFSVNASAQFCGVAEMIGPVDFEKSVDYWQQDKWTGLFPVKWHIVKDVPNNIFRHIILANNDNKPVTNSRDTQEVKLEQGLEMLKLFKGHESDMSILDDFEFYEERQKAMQERKAWQQKQHQQQPSSTSVLAGGTSTAAGETLNMPAISPDFIDQMPKSFAEAIRLEESKTEDQSADKRGFSASTIPEDLNNGEHSG